MPEAKSLISRLADGIGANRTVLALSAARLGDAVGNSMGRQRLWWLKATRRKIWV